MKRASIGLALAALLLASCTDIFNALFDTAAPTGVSASDGDNPDSVEVSWGAPTLTSDKWKGYRVDHYEVSWSGPSSGTVSVSGTSYSIPVQSGERARVFSVSVSTVLKSPGGSLSDGGSASDEGFALVTADLLWHDGGSAYAFSGADYWYVTMLQQGFVYSFDFAAGQSGSVEFYSYKTLQPRLAATVTGSSVSWRCDSAGAGNKFYVHVLPTAQSATFSASYGF